MSRKIVILSVIASVIAITHGEIDVNATNILPPEPLPTISPNNGTTTALPSTSPTPNTTTTSTTPSSTTTTTTTSPTTTPLPAAQTGKWRVNDTTNVTCILADMAIQVELVDKDNKTESFDVPTTALSNSSSCNNESQLLVLEWSELGGESSLAFLFLKNNSQFYLSQIELNVTVNNHSRVVLIESNITKFSTPLTKSYRCAKEQQLTLSGNNNESIATLKISHVQLEPFHEKKDNNFNAAEDCSTSSSPDIVPIAVGCALVGLVTIVLIAYLMGRRRSQARGYLSM